MAKVQQPTGAPPPEKEYSILDEVVGRIQGLIGVGELDIPPDYSPVNALKAAYLILSEQTNKEGQPVLSVATRQSVIRAMMQMILDGLSVAKGQAAFILRGRELTYQREYPGLVLLAKRSGGLKDVNAQVIYEGDDLEYEISADGIIRITKHVQSYQNIDLTKIKGAYAVVLLEDGTKKTTIMTISQIRSAWLQGGPLSKAHQNFPDEMAKKTVMARSLKIIVRASDDAEVMDTTPKPESRQLQEAPKFEELPEHEDPKPSEPEQNEKELPEGNPPF